MPLPLVPLLLAGVAVMALAGGRRRTGGRLNPTSGANKPLRTQLPPQQRDEAPLYPFESVMAVQEALLYLGYNPGAPDDAWGGKTRAALKSFQQSGFCPDCVATGEPTEVSLQILSRLAAQEREYIMACDPLLQDCPAGFLCFPVGDLFLCLPEWQNAPAMAQEAAEVESYGSSPVGAEIGPGGFREIVVAPDFSSAHIGGGWVLGTLDPWLKERMDAGELAMLNHWSTTMENILWNDPLNFWWSTLSSHHGPIEWQAAREGKLPGAPRLDYDINDMLSDMATDLWTDMKREPSLGAVVIAAAGMNVWGFQVILEFTVVPPYIVAGLALASAFMFVSGVASNILSDQHRDAMVVSSTWVWDAFLASHYARIGDQDILLSDIPVDSPAGDQIRTVVMKYISRFQRMEID